MTLDDFKRALEIEVNACARANLDPYAVRDALRERANKIDEACAIVEALGGRTIPDFP